MAITQLTTRTNNEIVASMLKSAIKGANSLKIMDGAYINHTNLKKYLKILIGNNMIEYESETRIFRTSEKGIEFLRFIENLKRGFHGIATVILTKSDHMSYL